MKGMSWLLIALAMAVPISPAIAQVDNTALTQMFPALVGVELSPAQTKELQELSRRTLPQIQSLLTPEQRVQFDSALAQGKGVRVAALSLNLSMSQRQKMIGILQSTKSHLAAILSPEQQQQIQQNASNLQKQNR
jgi:hypothetical protein